VSRTKSSARWLERHVNDPYVKESRARGLASRAAFKLEEIQQRDRIFRPGMTVVDLGAAPGGWSQVAARGVLPRGRVIAVDLLPVVGGAGIEVITGDIRSAVLREQLQNRLGENRVDLVISDLAPNLSGIASIDQARTLELAQLALQFSRQFLTSNGSFLVKFFHGTEEAEFIQQLRRYFSPVIFRKPAASRAESREIYLLGKNFDMSLT